MQRTTTMTWGFVLIFLGAQLAVVDSLLLTPRISNFLSPRGTPEPVATAPATGISNPFNQVGFGNAGTGNQSGPAIGNPFNQQQRISPPDWLCWPVLFCGTVVLLHGATMKPN